MVADCNKWQIRRVDMEISTSRGLQFGYRISIRNVGWSKFQRELSRQLRINPTIQQLPVVSLYWNELRCCCYEHLQSCNWLLLLRSRLQHEHLQSCNWLLLWRARLQHLQIQNASLYSAPHLLFCDRHVDHNLSIQASFILSAVRKWSNSWLEMVSVK